MNNQAAFIVCLRQYTKFINFLVKEVFIPDDDYSIHRIAYEPYVFTDNELTTLYSIDSYTGSTNNRKFKPDIVLTPMFYCGMRPAESLHLHCEDLDLGTADYIL